LLVSIAGSSTGAQYPARDERYALPGIHP
jgi:hypothetical protein